MAHRFINVCVMIVIETMDDNILHFSDIVDERRQVWVKESTAAVRRGRAGQVSSRSTGTHTVPCPMPHTAQDRTWRQHVVIDNLHDLNSHTCLCIIEKISLEKEIKKSIKRDVELTRKVSMNTRCRWMYARRQSRGRDRRYSSSDEYSDRNNAKSE